MRSLPLRWRIIIALIALTLGTTLALSLLAQHFLESGLQLQDNISASTSLALNDAVDLAKNHYESRKEALGDIGNRLFRSTLPAEAVRSQDLQPIRDLLDSHDLGDAKLRFAKAVEIASLNLQGPPSGSVVRRADDGDASLEMFVPIFRDGPSDAALVITSPMIELNNVEQAVQAHQYLRMIGSDLRSEFFFYFLAATIGLLLLACLMGVRIGFGVTHPLDELVKGTRELAKDNLDYRIPAGRDDEIGLLIGSFNRMAEDLTQNRRQRLEAEKIAAWREIARRLAHEIKNPLTPIQLTVQQIRDKYPGNDPAYTRLVHDCTEIVTEEVESLRKLVQEFADFARMPSLSLGRHSLNDVITDIVRLYPEAGIVLDLTPKVPDLDLDSEQMRRVLINLIENGLEAAGQHGRIVIQTENHPDSVKLLVVDSGPGVPERDRERIFQPHVTSKQSGMGMGLAEVRSIIESHGGQIVAASAPGGGAQFEITLPVPGVPARQPEESI
ncbi:MAG: ATP-binding protein [Gemmatimonadota bacterium]|nr:ATP-binding protein [Gemmatimonadota bacterium]